MGAVFNLICFEDCCCMCGLAIPELLTNAHIHGSRRTVRLCWNCHRAYDIDILTTREVLAAERAVRGRDRQVDVNALHQTWERDLAIGKRRVNKRRQHGRTFEQSSANARRAWDNMRARRGQTAVPPFTEPVNLLPFDT